MHVQYTIFFLRETQKCLLKERRERNVSQQKTGINVSQVVSSVLQKVQNALRYTQQKASMQNYTS